MGALVWPTCGQKTTAVHPLLDRPQLHLVTTYRESRCAVRTVVSDSFSAAWCKRPAQASKHLRAGTLSIGAKCSKTARWMGVWYRFQYGASSMSTAGFSQRSSQPITKSASNSGGVFSTRRNSKGRWPFSTYRPDEVCHRMEWQHLELQGNLQLKSSHLYVVFIAPSEACRSRTMKERGELY